MTEGLDEFQIIARHFAPLARSGTDVESFRLMDDAATIKSKPGRQLVVTSDSLVSGVHLFGDEPAALIAQKALRTNLSDLAGKGASPLGYTLALHLPPGVDDAWLSGFAKGLSEDQSRYGVTLLGGDTTASRTLAIAITAIGEVAGGTYSARQHARAMDDIWVTGTIGDAALGLKLFEGTLKLEDESGVFLRDRYRLPQPRFEVQSVLATYGNGAMDVSDGLIADLAKMCRAANVGAQIVQADIPLSGPARVALGGLPADAQHYVYGGDDYEVLFTAAPKHRTHITAMAAELSFPVTRIGHITDIHGSGEVLLMDATGNPVQLESTGHTHRI